MELAVLLPSSLIQAEPPVQMTSGRGVVLPDGMYRSRRWPLLPAGCAGAYAILLIVCVAAGAAAAVDAAGAAPNAAGAAAKAATVTRAAPTKVAARIRARMIDSPVVWGEESTIGRRLSKATHASLTAISLGSCASLSRLRCGEACAGAALQSVGCVAVTVRRCMQPVNDRF